MPQVVLSPGGLQPLVSRRVSACSSEPAAFNQQRFARAYFTAARTEARYWREPRANR